MSSESILSLKTLYSYFLSWKIYLLVGKFLKTVAFMSSIGIIIPFDIKFGWFKKGLRSSSFSIFEILILNIYLNSVNILEKWVWSFSDHSRSKILRCEKLKILLRLHTRKLPVIKINTFANALIFIFCEVKDIPFGEWLYKKFHYEHHMDAYSILHKIRHTQEQIEIILIFYK